MQELTKRPSLYGLEVKEDGDEYIVKGLVATTHADKVGDILSKKALQQIVDKINNSDASGDSLGSYRSVSWNHDWVRKNDPTLDSAAFLTPGSASLIALKDGHHGVEVEAKINKYYRGKDDTGSVLTPEEIKYRIENGAIAGFSIEYEAGDTFTTKVRDVVYRVIDSFKQYAGQGFARDRMIANPHAVIYKEIEENIKEEPHGNAIATPMEPEATSVLPPETLAPEQKQDSPVTQDTPTAPSEPVAEAAPVAEVEAKETTPVVATIDVKELVKTTEFKEAVLSQIKVQTKTIKTTKEDTAMEQTTISVKEMNAALTAKNGFPDAFAFKEAASKYFSENPEYDKMAIGNGIPLNTSLQLKCEGQKLRIVGSIATKEIEVKGTLDTTTNASTYTQNISEFADVYVPAIVDTFNNLTNLLGFLEKRDHIEGGNKYGWVITTDRKSGLSVDPNNTTINKEPVSKLKLQTDMKEYRIGVGISEYTMYHSRASFGDLLMIEVQKRMKDLLKDINVDLYTAQTDTTTKIIGLKGVADSAGNTVLYGLTRSSANRLAPATAATTYLSVSGALTEANIRTYKQNVELEGASQSNIVFVTGPKQRDVLFALMAARQYVAAPSPQSQLGFGFNGIMYDGVPVLVDPDCPNNQFFILDRESVYIVMSKPPVMTGLAKVSAAEEAYISTYLALVYEAPRKIGMLDTLS